MGVLFALFLVGFCLYEIKMPWWYDCLISRIPIFIFGIICAKYKLSFKNMVIIMIIGIISFIPCYIYISKFLATSLIVLPILVSLILVQEKYIRYRNVLQYIGRHSLEIYLANVLILYIFEISDLSKIYLAISYILLQFMLSYILILINQKVNEVIGHKSN